MKEFFTINTLSASIHQKALTGSLAIPRKDTVSVRLLNTNVTFQAVQGSMLIYKVLGGTLKVIIVFFMIVLSCAMREKIIVVNQKLTR